MIGKTFFLEEEVRVQLLIFTDLDGSLLNSHDYSFEDARPILEFLRKNLIPVIFCTSKTRTETELLRSILDVNHPFIVENGGGIYFSAAENYEGIRHAVRTGELLLIQLGQPYETIRDFIRKNQKKFTVEGFGDWTIEVIQQRTGLKAEDAAMARQREFTEPFLLRNPRKMRKLEFAAKRANLKIVKGGRFFHLIGEGQDKGKAVEIVKRIYEQTIRKPVYSIGLGDSANDIPMLRSVDIPILIPHADGTFVPFESPNLVKAEFPGSKGWGRSLQKVLDELSRAD